MAKYIGTYASSGDVQTAIDNQELNRPFIAYTTDNDQVYYGAAADRAEAGDIVVYSVADDLLHYIKQADYNTTSYPAADYVPVGVVAYPQTDDAILGPTGEITFMGLNWLDKDKPDTGNNDEVGLSWGYRNFDIPELTNYANSGTAITDMNGKANTQVVLQYATAQTDWRTASAITNSYETPGIYPIFECAWRYHTSGTVQGDWYIPSAGQLYKMIGQKEAINNSLVKTGGIILPSTSRNCAASTELNNISNWTIYFINNTITADNKGNARFGRPFCSKLMTRI